MTAAGGPAHERVAWLTLEPPDRHGGGGGRRQFFLIDALRPYFDVEILPVDVPSELPGTLASRMWARRSPGGAALLTRSPYGDRVLQQLRRSGITTAVVAHIETAALLRDLLRAEDVRVVVDMHNLYSRYYAARGERLAAAAWRGLERRVGALADAVTVLSREEAAALATPRAAVAVVANGVDPAEWPTPPPLRSAAGLAYVGSWQHSPNRTGLEWFLTQVWPTVRKQVPTATLHLYGPGRPPVGNAEGVVAHGRADDLAVALGQHRASLVPIIEGVGTRLKFIESLAAGVPVVTTALGAEGYDVPPDCCLIARDAAAFADSCVQVLTGGDELERMAGRAREAAIRKYAWSNVAGELLRVLSR